MSRAVVKFIITRLLSKYESGVLNKDFQPSNYYGAVVLCCAHNKDEIKNCNELNQLWNKKQQAKLRGDERSEQIIDGIIKAHITKDRAHIHKYLDATRDIDLEGEEKKDAWNKKSFGLPDYAYL